MSKTQWNTYLVQILVRQWLLFPPDVDELKDEDEVDEENLNAPTICDIPRAGISKLFPWRATLLIF